MIDMKEQERKSKERNNAAFDKWLSEPMVRMGISMIPAGDNKDALQMLLRSAFDAGVANGGADVAVSLLDAMLRKDMKKGGVLD